MQQHIAGLHQMWIVMMMSDIMWGETKISFSFRKFLISWMQPSSLWFVPKVLHVQQFHVVCCLIIRVRGILLEHTFRACQLCDQVLWKVQWLHCCRLSRNQAIRNDWKPSSLFSAKFCPWWDAESSRAWSYTVLVSKDVKNRCFIKSV